MSIHGKQPLATPEFQIKALELHKPYELRCPHCGCLYARFWAEGHEEFLRPFGEIFDDFDDITEREAHDGIWWIPDLHWGMCHRCARHYLAVELCGSTKSGGGIFVCTQTEGIPKFGVSLRHCSPDIHSGASLAFSTTSSGASRIRGNYLIRRENWIALRTEEDGNPIESHLIGLFPLDERPAAGWVADDNVTLDRKLTEEGRLAAVLRDLLARYYRPFCKGKSCCVSGTSGQCAQSLTSDGGSQG